MQLLVHSGIISYSTPIQIESDAVVLAVPSHIAANIIDAIDPEMSQTLRTIYYPPVAEIVLGYEKEHPC
ncbi:MAG: hypothetical protein QME25_07500 [Bacteroidota bacterium]|nr:hypothetical protein [Bacteroidota bacterium]